MWGGGGEGWPRKDTKGCGNVGAVFLCVLGFYMYNDGSRRFVGNRLCVYSNACRIAVVLINLRDVMRRIDTVDQLGRVSKKKLQNNVGHSSSVETERNPVMRGWRALLRYAPYCGGA